MSQRYYLDSDDDGHHYVVPVNLREAFAQWIESWADYDYAPGTSEPQMPEGVISLGCSPTCVTFENPRISQD